MSKERVERSRRRISLTLDAAILPERVILRRLEELPQGSATDWLRSLLTQGLLVEGRWHRGLQVPPGDTDQLELGSAAYAAGGEGEPSPASTGIPSPAPPVSALDQTKPFARLRQVIG